MGMETAVGPEDVGLCASDVVKLSLCYCRAKNMGGHDGEVKR
jgi:hypothetical protein